MDPATAEQQELERKKLAVEQNVAPEEDYEDDEDDDEDDEDEDEEDEDDEDEDDDVATDEDGKETLRTQAPNVDSDRVPATDAEPEGSLDHVKSAPLGIQQIEDLEDDAKGG